MIKLRDGRAELYQWDTGRVLSVPKECTQAHYSNKMFGRSLDVDVVDGTAIIPDVFLQTAKPISVWCYVGTSENGFTKVSKQFEVIPRNKPADYVFTPTEQLTLIEIEKRVEALEKGGGGCAGQPGEDGGYYTPAVSQPNANTMRMEFTASKADMPPVAGVEIALPRGGSGGGLNATASALLISILRNGVYTADQSVNITALEAALAEGGGSGEPVKPPEPGIIQTGNILAIVSGVTAAQSGSVLSIA